MQVHNRGSPDFNELEPYQKSLLLDPLVEVIKDFYKQDKNRQAYQKWLADGKPMPNEIQNKEVVQYEQTKMRL